MKRSFLPIYTFAAIFFVIVVVGLATVPVVLRYVDNQYLDLQSDINHRQAAAFARFTELRLAQGISPKEVLNELSRMLAGADADRGFTCVISQDSLQFLSHPMTEKVGQPVASAEAELAPRGSDKRHFPLEEAIWEGFDGDGIITMPDKRREVVFLQSIPSVRWTIATHENTARVERELALIRRNMVIGFCLLGLLIAVPSSYAARRVSSRYERIIEDRNQRIEREQAVSEKLLLNILPASIAKELKDGREVIAEHHDQVGVLFADLVGFTQLASRIPAQDLVQMLNEIFSAFDELAREHGLEKIKTIGDSYMVCGNLPEPQPDHVRQLASLALAMLEKIQSISSAHELELQLRIGMDIGPAVAGVIGKHKFSYDLWGDVVNTASRMESTAKPGRIHVTAAVENVLRDDFVFEPLPEQEIKGKGRMATYRLVMPRNRPIHAP